MRSDNYKRLLGSSKWKRIRMMYLARHPLCEECLKNGRTTPAVDIHHIDPIDNYSDYETMRKVAYDPNNLEALCVECHHRIHEEMESGTKATNRLRASNSAKVFMKKWLE